MTERADITVRWGLSPRIITVDSPSVTVSIQDLHDTLKSNTLPAGEADDSMDNMDDTSIIDSAGKEDLGGGLEVGITATLQNAQLAFEKVVNKLETGTITTGDATGTLLIDSTATFITNLVQRGDTIVNHDDNSSVATVLAIVSENELIVDGLVGGSINQFTFGDAYDVFELRACTVTGGNLVAVDDVGDPLNTILPTFGTHVTLSASTSATLVDGDISQQIVEGNITVQGALRAALSALVGLLSGAGGTSIAFRDTGDTKDRIVATVDSDGNRLSVTLDLSD